MTSGGKEVVQPVSESVSPHRKEQTNETSQAADNTGEVVITMQHGDEDEAWVSADDGICSSTESESSTPGYKRGRHEAVPTEEVVQLITQEAQEKMAAHKHSRGPSLQILSDARVNHWPSHDNVCIVNHHPKWSFKKWVAAEVVRIECDTVVIYLEMTQEFDDVLP